MSTANSSNNSSSSESSQEKIIFSGPRYRNVEQSKIIIDNMVDVNTTEDAESRKTLTILEECGLMKYYNDHNNKLMMKAVLEFLYKLKIDHKGNLVYDVRGE